MRKVTAVVLALGLMGGVVVGCGVPGGKSVSQKIETQAQQLENQNYQSEAKMTVQMDNNVQTYYVEVSYESPETYKIALGNQDKQIHQIIVHNKNGMFIVSPSLGKVFRFNGKWAENQGQIYLYDQLLNEIAKNKDIKPQKGNGTYTFNLPVTPASDTISTQKVVLDSKTLQPQTVSLLDKSGKAAVSLQFTSFKTGVTFNSTDFDPHSLAGSGASDTKTTMAGSSSAGTSTGSSGSTSSNESFGYIEPKTLYGTKMTSIMQPSQTSAILRFGGEHTYTLEEWRPTKRDMADPGAELVDLFGVPAMYTLGDSVNTLTWLNNGVEFSIMSNDMNLQELQDVAISTLGQVGK